MANLKKIIAEFLKEHRGLLNFIVHYYNRIKLNLKPFIKKILGYYKKPNPQKFIFPTELQLPLTYKCNCDCIMCGMKNMSDIKGFSPSQLKIILKDRLFSKVKTIGLNGGEPFILKNLPEYASVVLECLPNIKSLYLITNASLGTKMLPLLTEIKNNCSKHSIYFGVSISIDAVGTRHDEIRKYSGLFNIIDHVCDVILENPNCYMDSFGAICTITKMNVEYLAEIQSWAKYKGISMSYNVATLHKRLDNSNRYEDFSVLSDKKTLLLATEFFYSLYRETNSKSYFALYYYLRTGHRISKCNYQENGVTLTPEGNMYYCATYSETIGNAFTDLPTNNYINNLKYRNKLVESTCHQCSHYTSALTYEGEIEYIKETLLNKQNPLHFLT